MPKNISAATLMVLSACIIWGAQPMFVTFVVREFDPIPLVSIRYFTVGVVLLAALAYSGEKLLPPRKAWLPLFLMGAAFCFVDLTSALPYFGFLALLAGYQLIFPLVFAFILLYNFIYILPLLLLYWGYRRLQGTKAIQRLESLLSKVSLYIVPCAISLFSAVLVFHGINALL